MQGTSSCRARRLVDWCTPTTSSFTRHPWVTRGLHAYLPESSPSRQRKIRNGPARRPVRKPISYNQILVPSTRTIRKRRKTRSSIKTSQNVDTGRSAIPGRRSRGCSASPRLRESLSHSPSPGGSFNQSISWDQVARRRSSPQREELPRRKVVRHPSLTMPLPPPPPAKPLSKGSSSENGINASIVRERTCSQRYHTYQNLNGHCARVPKDQGIVDLQAAFDAMLWDYLLTLEQVCPTSVLDASNITNTFSSINAPPTYVQSHAPSPATYSTFLHPYVPSPPPTTYVQSHAPSPATYSTFLHPYVPSPPPTTYSHIPSASPATYSTHLQFHTPSPATYSTHIKPHIPSPATYSTHLQSHTPSPLTYSTHIESHIPSPSTYSTRTQSHTPSLATYSTHIQSHTPSLATYSTHIQSHTPPTTTYSTHVQSPNPSPPANQKHHTSSGCLAVLGPDIAKTPPTFRTQRPRERRTPLSPRTIMQARKSKAAFQPSFDIKIVLGARAFPKPKQSTTSRSREDLPTVQVVTSSSGWSTPSNTSPPTQPNEDSESSQTALSIPSGIIRALTFRSIVFNPNTERDPSEEIVYQDLTSPSTIKRVEAALSHVSTLGRFAITDLRELPRPMSKLAALQTPSMFELRQELHREGLDHRDSGRLRLFSEGFCSKRHDEISEREPSEANGPDRPDRPDTVSKASLLLRLEIETSRALQSVDCSSSWRSVFAN